MRIGLLVLFIGLGNFVSAQLSEEENQYVDSLKSVIASSAHDTIKINALVEWEDMIYQFDRPLDLIINRKLAEICISNLKNAKDKKLKYFFERNLAYAYNNMGSVYEQERQKDSALYFYHKGLDLRKTFEDRTAESQSLGNIGLVYSRVGSFDTAVSYYLQSLAIKEEMGNKKGMAKTLNDLGLIYQDKGELKKSIEYLTASLRIYEEIKDSGGTGTALNNIGIVYHVQLDYDHALKYYRKALKIFLKLNQDYNVAYGYNNLGLIYNDKEQYDKALYYFEKSLAIREKTNFLPGIAMTLNNMGITYKRVKEYDKAIDYFKRSFEMKEKMGNLLGMSTSTINIAEIYLEKKEYTAAIQYAKLGLKYASEIDAKEEMGLASGVLYYSYKSLHNFKDALSAHEMYIAMRDTVSGEDSRQEVLRYEIQYEYDKKKFADSVINAEKEHINELELLAEKSKVKEQKTQLFALVGGLALVGLFALFIVNRLKVTRRQKNIIEQQKAVVEHQKEEVEHQRELLEEKNKEILDSITYARRLQEAILPSPKIVKEYLTSSFILYKPKDIVAGDFYFLEPLGNKIIFAAADCTGHGVPGAMVSVVCSNALNRAVKEYHLSNPGEILNKVRELVEDTFSKSDDEVKDGMDISLCSLSLNHAELEWSGANNPLWIIRNNSTEVEEIKADKQPIGKYSDAVPFKNHTILLNPGDTLYVFTDGFQDQFGGEKGKKYKASKLKEFLVSIQTHDMMDQHRIINEEFENWKGSLEQVDDVCLIGVRL